MSSVLFMLSLFDLPVKELFFQFVYQISIVYVAARRVLETQADIILLCQHNRYHETHIFLQTFVIKAILD